MKSLLARTIPCPLALALLALTMCSKPPTAEKRAPDARPRSTVVDAGHDTRVALAPEIRDWTLAIELDPGDAKKLPGDAYQLLDDDNHLVRSLPMLLCQDGRPGKGVPKHAMVRCKRQRRGQNWWLLTFEKIDYNQSYTLVAHMDPKHGFGGGDPDLFTRTSPRTMDDRGRASK